MRASAVVDLRSIRANLAVASARADGAALMAVVKADAYGHGMVPVAREARAVGVPWLGVALPSEAVALRNAGDDGRILAWLWTPGDPDVDTCVAGDVDLSVSSLWALEDVVAAARRHSRVARVHLKVDTGLSRNGVTLADLPDLATRLRIEVDAGDVDLVAVWTHLADADLPGSDSVGRQRDRFEEALALVRSAGLDVPMRHLSNSGGLWAHPDLRADLVRVGIAMYGLAPADVLGSPRDLGLVPAMTLRTELSGIKRVEAGTTVSYGGTWTAPTATWLGLVPLGYADGIPRAASERVDVTIAGRRYPSVGRVAMDQFVVDLGPQDPRDADCGPGRDVVLFGPGADGEATADDWARAIGTIGYELVTRVGPRVPRTYVGATADAAPARRPEVRS